VNYKLLTALAALCISSIDLIAGPPFFTDDPAPVDYKDSEFYLFSTYDQTKSGKNAGLPAFEYNYGVLPDMQLHIVVPFIRSVTVDSSSEYGTGDIELGIKYRFIQETDTSPQIGIFPMAELATGDSTKGLGNGKTWWRLPIWAQKSWGEWTTYGGVGLVINQAEGKKNYSFAGWQLQKELSEKWTLGAEVFGRQKDTVDTQKTTIVNLGGYYKFTPDFNLLFSAGHSLYGENHTVAYLGLWWVFGGDTRECLPPISQPAWSMSQTSIKNI
jgi:Putative MetA-pathway of phenol degradation